MWGAIIGDIVGSRFEFENCRSKEFALFHPNCEFTDDTLMTIAVAYALYRAGRSGERVLAGETVRAMQAFAKMYPYVGWGGFFSEWLKQENPKPYGSWGNGAAMRVSPVGEYARSEEEVKALSRAVTAVSHDHPEGLKGAECTAMCVYLAKNGAAKEEIFARAKKYYPELGSNTVSYQFDESCQGTVPEALLCFFEGKDFEDTIRNAVSIGGDSDTIAAIAGGVAEAFFGIPQALVEEAKRYLPDELLWLVENIGKEWK